MMTLREKRERQRQIAGEMRREVATLSMRLNTELASLGLAGSGFVRQEVDAERELASAFAALDELERAIAVSIAAIVAKGG